MNKSYLLFAVPALLLGACSSEEDGLVPTGNGVTFEVSLPADMATRAFADGLSANRLQYSVFEHSDKPDQPGKYLFDDEVQFPEGEWTTTVNLDLVKGKDYDVVFWASKSTSTTTTDPAGNQTTTVSSVYTFNPQTPSIHIDYTGIAVNDEGRDAFFGVKRKVHVENNATSEKVYLYRPFAQVNVGTDDLKAAQKAGFGTVEDNIKTDVYVDNVYADLNLYTGQASNKVNGGLTFAKAGLPKDADGRFPLNEEGKEPVYKYMSMNYILTGVEVNSGATFEKGDYVNRAQSENVNLKLKFYDGETEINTLEIPNVPVQRNYRTNIYGSLLTSKVAFTVEKVPGFFDEPGFNVPPTPKTDGTTLYFDAPDQKYLEYLSAYWDKVDKSADIHLGEGFKWTGPISLPGHTGKFYDSKGNVVPMLTFSVNPATTDPVLKLANQADIANYAALAKSDFYPDNTKLEVTGGFQFSTALGSDPGIDVLYEGKKLPVPTMVPGTNIMYGEVNVSKFEEMKTMMQAWHAGMYKRAANFDHLLYYVYTGSDFKWEEPIEIYAADGRHFDGVILTYSERFGKNVKMAPYFKYSNINYVYVTDFVESGNPTADHLQTFIDLYNSHVYPEEGFRFNLVAGYTFDFTGKKFSPINNLKCDIVAQTATIKGINLDMSGEDNVGFIRQMTGNGKISNTLKMQDCTITGHNNVGLYVGYADVNGGGDIINTPDAIVRNKVTGYENVGILFGYVKTARQAKCETVRINDGNTEADKNVITGHNNLGFLAGKSDANIKINKRLRILKNEIIQTTPAPAESHVSATVGLGTDFITPSGSTDILDNILPH